MEGKKGNMDRTDREITDRTIRVRMKYYVVYFIRIIIYFVDDMMYVLSIFSYFLSKQNVFLATVDKFLAISFQFYSGTLEKNQFPRF